MEIRIRNPAKENLITGEGGGWENGTWSTVATSV